MGLTPAEIERAKFFAQRWRPSPRTGAHCWIRKRVPRQQVHWFVPPIVIPILIVLGLLVYVTIRAFH
jgi:hypothetical protein